MNELIMMLNAIRLEIRNLRLQQAIGNTIAWGDADAAKIGEAGEQSRAMLDESELLARQAISNSAYRENQETG